MPGDLGVEQERISLSKKVAKKTCWGNFKYVNS